MQRRERPNCRKEIQKLLDSGVDLIAIASGIIVNPETYCLSMISFGMKIQARKMCDEQNIVWKRQQSHRPPPRE
jgi:hypothetical protein